MPIVSQAQRRLMYSAAADKAGKAGKAGVSQKVAREFVASDKPGKLPEKKRKDLYDHPGSKPK